MIYVRTIDSNGFFVEDAFVDELTPFTIETPCPPGFYRPKWDGIQWVEGGTAPEPTTKSQIEVLKAQLSATDYKAIKYAEGWISEEDYTPIKAERQALRDRINALELAQERK